MFEQFSFYIKHSLNDLGVNKRLTFFALLSIAAGVAAIVSLQTLALMIGASVTGNLQETNQGDVQAIVSAGSEEEDAIYAEFAEDGVLVAEDVGFFGQTGTVYSLAPDGLEALQTWIDESKFAGTVEFTYQVPLTDPIQIFLGSGSGSSFTVEETGETVSNLTAFVVDPTVYPYYGEITTLDGQPLSEVLQAPNDIVIGENALDEVDVAVGDTIRVAGASEPFVVRGIVAIEQGVRDPSTGLLAGIFGFYYVNYDAVDLFGEEIDGIDSLYFKLDDPEQTVAFADALSEEFIFFSTTTTEDLRIENEEAMEQITQLMTIMGLVSLLIGSIGIINTMQVIVRRRMLEVGVLKTLGMQGNQITLLFLTEAFLLGIIGSVFGIILGWIGTFALRSVAEALTTSNLAFFIAPQPAINGFVMGLAVATVFGFLPTLAAAQVRPGIVIRPQEGVIPRAGILQTLAVLALIILVISVITWTILSQPFIVALGSVAGAFVAAGIIYVVLWVLIWIVGRLFPSLGIVDLKVSLRQMLASKGRGASTLLALVIGVFSLSTITLFAQSITGILSDALEQEGNVLITIQSYDELDDVTEMLDELEGVNSYQTTLNYDMQLVEWQDTESGNTYAADEIEGLLAGIESDFPPFFDGTEEERAELQYDIVESVFSSVSVEAREITEDSDLKMAQGRVLTPDDNDGAFIVYGDAPLLADLGISEGDIVTYNVVTQGAFGGETTTEVTFEVAGIAASQVVAIASSGTYATYGGFPDDLNPTGVAVSADIEEEQLSELRVQLADIPGTFALETAILTQLISGLLAQFTAFPTLVAALGLVVGGVVIANSVALATMERRNEIAVMKAVGLQRERVLGMLLLENGILGFIGGFIGVGIGLVTVLAFASISGAPFSSIPWLTAFSLMMLCVGVAVVAAISSAWAASGEKPLTVLRYE